MRLDRIRKNPLKLTGWAFGFLAKSAKLTGSVQIPIQNPSLAEAARGLAGRVKRFGLNLPWVFKKCGTEERFIQAQYLHERIADIAIDLYVGSCVLSRLDHLRSKGDSSPAEIEAGEHFLRIAFRRIDQNFAALYDNDDDATTSLANKVLGKK
jgi:hypothetical protein